ncbi:GNAT family N-acetyltransferase [Rossellomorea vietnamensis]|uniref:GNAT family N-acetyltransferase n=1 Tax=Rossellomorea vietnamensis TaxID=218284 RepID=A0A5D4MI31_9BACI|nr:GNAT family N-acetyltransferase [Rossellomorea vietnamensis]TYS01227.1 GNAT family N-acetyltransferase [Rossellomorea vietnamensis]
MMERQIRKISGNDYEKFCKLANSAFQGLNADKWLKNHIEETSREDLYGMFKANELIAGMRSFDFEVNYSSTPIKAGGVGMVAVDMMHKRERNAYQLLQYLLQINEKANANLVMLHPFKVSFYKKMGFGIGTKNYQFYISPGEFPDYKEKGHLAELGLEDREGVLDCYNRVYSRTHGMTKRFPFERELNRPFSFGKVIGFVDEGEVKGYFVYSIEEKDLYIHELFFESPQVLREISTFLHRQSDQINRVVMNSNSDELLHFVNSPESGQTTMVDFPSATDNKHTANAGIGVMYRIINCINFFKDLKKKNHQFNPGVTLSVQFSINDDFYPSNSMSFIVAFEKGKIVEVNEKGSYDVEIKMNIAEFSSMVMGVENAHFFLRLGLMEISDSGYRKIINSLFQMDSKPVVVKAF